MNRASDRPLACRGAPDMGHTTASRTQARLSAWPWGADEGAACGGWSWLTELALPR